MEAPLLAGCLRTLAAGVWLAADTVSRVAPSVAAPLCQLADDLADRLDPPGVDGHTGFEPRIPAPRGRP